MNERTQTCECGNDTYHIKWSLEEASAWAECTECGRPTRTIGDPDKQREWQLRQPQE